MICGRKKCEQRREIEAAIKMSVVSSPFELQRYLSTRVYICEKYICTVKIMTLHS